MQRVFETCIVLGGRMHSSLWTAINYIWCFECILVSPFLLTPKNRTHISLMGSHGRYFSPASNFLISDAWRFRQVSKLLPFLHGLFALLQGTIWIYSLATYSAASRCNGVQAIKQLHSSFASCFAVLFFLCPKRSPLSDFLSWMACTFCKNMLKLLGALLLAASASRVQLKLT